MTTYRIPAIKDIQLRDLVDRHAAPNDEAGQGFARDNKGIAMLGRASLVNELTMLVISEIKDGEAEVLEATIQQLTSEGTLEEVATSSGAAIKTLAQQRQERFSPINPSANASALSTAARQLCAYLGALMFDGQGTGSLPDRQWTRPLTIRTVVKRLFEDRIRDAYEAAKTKREASVGEMEDGEISEAESITRESSVNGTPPNLIRTQNQLSPYRPRPTAPEPAKALIYPPLDMADAALNLWCQTHGRNLLVKDVRLGGADHMPTFGVVVEVDGNPVGYGQGRSKKEGKKKACRAACETLGVTY